MPHIQFSTGGQICRNENPGEGLRGLDGLEPSCPGCSLNPPVHTLPIPTPPPPPLASPPPYWSLQDLERQPPHTKASTVTTMHCCHGNQYWSTGNFLRAIEQRKGPKSATEWHDGPLEGAMGTSAHYKGPEHTAQVGPGGYKNSTARHIQHSTCIQYRHITQYIQHRMVRSEGIHKHTATQPVPY